MTRLSALLIAASVVAASTFSAQLRAEPAAVEAGARWTRLGERTVDGRLDRDAIVLEKSEGPFTAVRLDVEGSSVAVFDIKITFGNGETFEPKTRLVFDEGSRSRVIDLPGAERHIARIEMRYGNLPGSGRARVQVLGQVARWEKLGARTVEGKADRDVIQVPGDLGAFRAIQFNVEGSALALYDIKVTFGNGEVFEPKTRLVFEKGTGSRVIDLPGERRAITRIELRYGNLPGGGRARVEVLAR